MPGVESPCIRNCCLDDEDVCLGCHRTVQEIMAWSEVDDDARREILDKAETRQKQKEVEWR